MNETEFELLAAFGPGATVVNVITGESTTLPGEKPVFDDCKCGYPKEPNQSVCPTCRYEAKKETP